MTETDSNTMTQAGLRKFLVMLLRYAGAKHPKKALVSGLRPLISHVQRAPKPAKKWDEEKPGPAKRGPGFITIQLPDDACQDLKPEHNGKDAWFLVRVDREVLAELKERSESRIIRPGRIVT